MKRWMYGLSLLWPLMSSCVTPTGGSPEVATAPLPPELAELKQRAEGAPGDAALQRQLVNAYLDGHYYIEAYELVQALRETAGDNADDLMLLGRSCVGLGLFDEAAACYNGALRLKPGDTQATYELAYLLVARGERAMAEQLLAPALARQNPWWGFYTLALQLHPQPADQLKLLQQFKAQGGETPGLDDAISSLETKLKGEAPGRMIQGGGQVIESRISDHYRLTLKVNGGHTGTFQFEPSRRGITISDDFAGTLKLTGLNHVGFSDEAGKTRLLAATRARLDTLEVGNATFADVDVDLATEMQKLSVDGYIGPDIFPPDWAYRIDRKFEKLEFFPPDSPVPAPKTKAVQLKYYTFGSSILVDAAVRNTQTDVTTKGKMTIYLASTSSFYNLEYARRLGFGQFETTTTATTRTAEGDYDKAVLVRFSELFFGGLRFNTPETLATDLGTAGMFVPFGQLSWDVLSRFIMTFEPATHTLTLEPYE